MPIIKIYIKIKTVKFILNKNYLIQNQQEVGDDIIVRVLNLLP